jgi:outer membrane protein
MLIPICIATLAALAEGAPPAGETLTLAQAQDQALRQQPTLRQARGQTEAAEGRVEEARSGYLPQVTLTGNYQRTTGNFPERPGSIPMTPAVTAAGMAQTRTVSAQLFNYYTFGASATQLIYDFGQTLDRTRAAGANRDAAVASQQTVTSQVLLTVRRAYFQARAQRDLVAVADEAVKNQEKHVTQIQAFVKNGIRPEIDLAQVRTTLANARVQLVGATNNYAVSLAQLNQAMGLPAGVPHALTDSELAAVPGEDGPPETLVTEALRARPELAALESQRRAQELTVSALRGGYGPALGAAAGATETGVHLDNLIPNWFVGLTLTWPILQGGLTRGQVREAEGTLLTANANEDVMRLQIQVEVEQGRLAIGAAKESITAAGEALTNARDQLRLAEARYTNGLGSAIELDDAQVAFSNAEAQEVGARFGLAAARAQLLAALGVR